LRWWRCGRPSEKEDYNNAMNIGINVLFFLVLFVTASSKVPAEVRIDQGGSGTVRIDGGGVGSLRIDASATVAVGPGDIGETTHNTVNTRGADFFVYSTFSVTTEGQVTHCHVHATGNTANELTCGLYDMNGNILAQANGSWASNTNAWTNFELDAPYTIDASTTHILGLVTNLGSWAASRRTTHTGHQRRQVAMTYTTTLTNHDFSGSSLIANDTSHTIYFDTSISDPN